MGDHNSCWNCMASSKVVLCKLFLKVDALSLSIFKIIADEDGTEHS